jgi:hypothetical protein
MRERKEGKSCFPSEQLLMAPFSPGENERFLPKEGRHNMSAPNATDTTNPPNNSLSRSSRSSHVIIGGISVPLQGAPLLPGQKSPVNYMLAQRALAETVDIRTALDSLRCFLISNQHAMLTHWRRTCSNTSAPTFATFERPFSPPSSFSLTTTFVSSLLNRSC